MYITVNFANLRTANNTKSSIIKQMPYRTHMKRVLILDSWSKVITDENETGYVFTNYISKNLPQITPPPRTILKWPAESSLSETFYKAKLLDYIGKPFDEASLPLKGITVILDPGHGGIDSGAVNSSGETRVFEKTINLRVSLKTGDLLKKLGADVIYTHKDDDFYGLYYRNALINKVILEKHKALLIEQGKDTKETDRLIGLMNQVMKSDTDDVDKNGRGVFLGLGVHEDLRTVMDISREYEDVIVLSIHSNQVWKAPSTQGVEIYYGTNAGIASDELKAAAVEPMSIPINKSYMYYNDAARKKLAVAIRDEMKSKTTLKTNRGYSNSIYAWNFCMIREHNLASALVELGFISNTSDRNYLTSANGQNAIAESLAAAVYDYYCK